MLVVLAKPVCCFKGTDCEPDPVHPEAMENFPETAASSSLDPELKERIFSLLQNAVSITFNEKCEILRWRQTLVKTV